MASKTEESIKQEINSFRDMIYNKYGIWLLIKLPKVSSEYPILMLEELEAIINDLITKDPWLGPGQKLTGRSRKRRLVVYRQLFYSIGLHMGYTTTHVGSYLGYDHATVIYSARTAKNQIEVGDPLTLEILKTIEDEIQERHGDDGVLQSDQQESADTKPVLSPLLNKRRYISLAHKHPPGITGSSREVVEVRTREQAPEFDTGSNYSNTTGGKLFHNSEEEDQQPGDG